MKLKIGQINEPTADTITPAVTPYVDPKYTDPSYDPFVLWSLTQTPVRLDSGVYYIGPLTDADLSKVVDTLVAAGIDAIQVTRKEKDKWDIHYYD